MSDTDLTPRVAQLNDAIREAWELSIALDECAGDLADWLLHHLRSVPGSRLCQLKAELAKFNAHTYGWKE